MTNFFNILRTFLKPPVFEGNEEKTRDAKLLHQIVITIWSLPVVAMIVSFINPSLSRFLVPVGIILAVTLTIIMLLNHAGKAQLGSTILVGIIFIAMTYLNYSSAGEPRPILLFSVIAILMSGLLLGTRGPIILSILLVAQHLTIVLLKAEGIIAPQNAPPGPVQNALLITAGYLLIGFMFRLAIARIQFAVNQLQISNGELQQLSGFMEQRVADRAKALTTSAEVSRRLALVTNTRQLAKEVVEHVQSAFHYYHAHIYFVDTESKELVMMGGTGEAGATMLAHGHKIPNGRGLVGRAASTNIPILVPDVTKEDGWLPNRLLPETRSEMAVPIAIGNQVLGVLDVQQNVVNGLEENDLNLLQSLAGQVAIALQNARTFEETTAKAEREALIITIGQKIQRAPTADDALNIAILELGDALGASRVKIRVSSSRDHSDSMNNN